MKFRTIASAALVALACAAPASAQTAAQLSVKDASGTTRSLCETLDGNGNLTPCLQAGAATSALQSSLGATAHTDAQATTTGVAAVVTALGSPAQAGGKVDTVIVGSSSDRGALVGTTSTTLMAANATRRGFSIQVQSSSASCYFSGIGAATADFHSIQLGGGTQPTLYETKDSHVGQGAINIICTAASTPVAAREW